MAAGKGFITSCRKVPGHLCYHYKTVKHLWITPLCVLLSSLILASAEARQLDGRSGVGLTMHDLDNTPTMSFRHHLSQYQSFVLLGGFNTASNKKTLILGGKFLHNVHIEENINVHLGMGGYLISGLVGGGPNASSGIELSGILGGEFFLPGLANLGFTFETGVAMRTIDNIHFATIGNGFLGLAIHYYF